MTTYPNAQLLRDAYQAAGVGDLEPLLGLLSEGITWTDSSLGPLAGTYTGQDEVPRFFARMMEVYDAPLQVEVVDVIGDDNRVIVLTRESGTVRGNPVTWSSAHIYSFDGGRCTRFVSYVSAEYQRFWAGRHDAA